MKCAVLRERRALCMTCADNVVAIRTAALSEGFIVGL